MGTLAAALAWASRGFRIFPLEEGSKEPIDIGWTTAATTDPEIIRRWWVDPVVGVERNYNIGCLASEWVIADADVKKGKRGLETMAELGLEFDTLTVVTPSGGFHLYYQKPDAKPVGQNPLGPDVDIRSHNGYVVAPGSKLIDGGEYRVLFDLPVSQFPEHLRNRLSCPKARPERQPTVSIDLDQPEFVEVAAHWLRTSAPRAIEGENGDLTTYRVSCRLRDFGLSHETAFTLLEEIWNESCDPPWEAEALRRKVDNAFQYATGVAGSAAAKTAFEDVRLLEAPNGVSFHHGLNGTPYHFGNLMPIGEIEIRPWVLGTMLLNKTVTELVASGGGGKSLLKLIIAAHLAVGKDFLGHKCYRPGKSICFDAEDDISEQSRRLNAICVAFGLDITIVRENVCLVSVDEILLQLTTPPPGLMINRDHIAKLIETITESKAVMLALGPLAELHSGNENDNIAMRYVMGVLRLVAREANIAVLVDHHTGKPPLAAADAWSGSQFAGRGASSIAGAARCVVTMFGATEKDCLEIGVPSTQRRQYVRIDTGKLNYGKPGPARWLRWQEVRLWNGDEVGVLAPFDAQETARMGGEVFAEDMVREIRKTGSASMPLNKALDILMRDPLIAKEGRATAKSRLQRMLATPMKVEEGKTELALLHGTKGIEGVAIR